jgi:hypothetical protein
MCFAWISATIPHTVTNSTISNAVNPCQVLKPAHLGTDLLISLVNSARLCSTQPVLVDLTLMVMPPVKSPGLGSFLERTSKASSSLPKSEKILI